MTRHDFQLTRDPFGRLILLIGNRTYNAVIPARSFPISARNKGIALVGADGSELVWIDTLDDLSENTRQLVEEELSSREFIPEIRRIRSVSSYATPSRWDVQTDRGDTVLVLKAEEDIRRLSASMLLIIDINSVQFLIRDMRILDKASRRMLDRFL
ncbi:MAG TPA: DUF1854 domain-containing protein [Eoetvoesiella sp.]